MKTKEKSMQQLIDELKSYKNKKMMATDDYEMTFFNTLLSVSSYDSWLSATIFFDGRCPETCFDCYARVPESFDGEKCIDDYNYCQFENHDDYMNIRKALNKYLSYDEIDKLLKDIT